jgi:hypothetical protein
MSSRRQSGRKRGHRRRQHQRQDLPQDPVQAPLQHLPEDRLQAFGSLSLQVSDAPAAATSRNENPLEVPLQNPDQDSLQDSDILSLEVSDTTAVPGPRNHLRHPWLQRDCGDKKLRNIRVPSEVMPHFRPGYPQVYHDGMPVLTYDKETMLGTIQPARTDIEEPRVHLMIHYSQDLPTWMDPYSRQCKQHLQAGVVCHCQHNLTEGSPPDTVHAIWWKLTKLNLALDAAGTNIILTPDEARVARLVVLFGAMQLLPTKDDGVIRFGIKKSWHTCHTFCVNALANYLGASFCDLHCNVKEEHMRQLKVAQYFHQLPFTDSRDRL